MGIFFKLQDRYEALMRAVDNEKTLPLADAAKAMRVSCEKVDDLLAKMARKGFFPKDVPYVDNALQLVIMAPRYHNMAVLVDACARCMLTLNRAAAVTQNGGQPPLPNRGETVKDFISGIAQDYTNRNMGNNFRRRAGELVQGILNPVSEQDRYSNQRGEQTIRKLYLLAQEIYTFVRLHPDKEYPPDITQEIVKLTGIASQYIQAFPNGRRTPAAAEMDTRFYNTLPVLQGIIDYLKRPEIKKQAPPEAPVLGEMRAAMEKLAASTERMPSAETHASLTRIGILLKDIYNILSSSETKCSLAPVRSLRSCYLPLLMELVGNYESMLRQRRDKATASAMQKCENVLARDVPEALDRIRRDLMTDSAMDLDAQATAMRQKLQLDGLVGIGLKK